MSTFHYESISVINSLYYYAKNKRLFGHGDGRSNGSVKIFGGVQSNGKANIAIMLVVDKHVNFVILQADSYDAGHSLLPSGATGLGNGRYTFTKDGTIICAWILTKNIGHEKHTEDQYLSVNQAREYWKTMQAEYQLFQEIDEILLP